MLRKGLQKLLMGLLTACFFVLSLCYLLRMGGRDDRQLSKLCNEFEL